jgi:hypothetical protein
MMLFNIGNRFINDGAIFAKYHVMETGYILETILASPSVVLLDYNFDLFRFDFELYDNEYSAKMDGFIVSQYSFTVDKNIDIDFAPFSLFNEFYLASYLRFSMKNDEFKNNLNDYLCPNYNSKVNSPIILIGIIKNDDKFNIDLMNYYDQVSAKFSNVIFEDISTTNKITAPNNLSIIVSDSNNEIDIIIYYQPNLKSIKLSCLIFNQINNIDFNKLDMVLVPSETITSDVQIDINFNSINIGTKDVQIPLKVEEAIRVFYR